ncbi:MAG: hypothetical protein NTY05_02025 [Rhodocyclales bacterium]|nr:hypothetical protein [Rhodocyclales bacterium]
MTSSSVTGADVGHAVDLRQQSAQTVAEAEQVDHRIGQVAQQ